MTRKEVCRTVGITVKTLRLYEEKGLIAPEKTRQNGRDYREYSPALVEQLEKIVLLRRALFTMEEIKTMQDSPSKIPEIFENYHLWLEQQTIQFGKLKMTADQIGGENLDTIDSLVESLSNTVSQMPLPQMDIKPNFKRIDAMEELPRHVEAQENFDEMVPSAKVLRQMTLVTGKNNVRKLALSLGQCNELRRSETWETSGPVQREQKMPLWYRIVSGIVTGLLAMCILGFLRMPYETFVRYGLLLLLLLEVLLMGIPAWLSQRRWHKNTASSGSEAWKKERKKRVRIILAGALGAAVLCGGIVVLCHVIDRQTNPPQDYRVLFAVPANLNTNDHARMEETLSQLVGDRNADGITHTDIDLAVYRNGMGLIDTRNGPMELDAIVSEGAYPLVFVTDQQILGVNVADEFSYRTICYPLPEELTEAVGECRIYLTGCELLASGDLETLSVYACIPKTATQEEYDFAVELLRKLLAQ